MIGYIYKITSESTDKIYVGSTKQNINTRLSLHMAHYKAYLQNGKVYYSSYEILKYGNAKICLIEEFEYIRREQLNKREGEIIKNTVNTVNMRIPGNKIRKKQVKTIQQVAKNREASKRYYLRNRERVINYSLARYYKKKRLT